MYPLCCFRVQLFGCFDACLVLNCAAVSLFRVHMYCYLSIYTSAHPFFKYSEPNETCRYQMQLRGPVIREKDDKGIAALGSVMVDELPSQRCTPHDISLSSRLDLVMVRGSLTARVHESDDHMHATRSRQSRQIEKCLLEASKRTTDRPRTRWLVEARVDERSWCEDGRTYLIARAVKSE